MSFDLDGMNAQLAEIIDRLIALPDDAFAERYELFKKQDELHKQAATCRRA